LIQSTAYSPATTQNKPSDKEKQQKVFFPNLDGLRFVCFLMVFLFHAYKTIFENLRGKNGAQDKPFYGVSEFLFQNGELGVNFFFVLSGFLITFLLIREKEFTGTVHLRNFYIRRILRIWPLFYLCVFIGFIVVPLLKSASGAASNEIANPLYYIFLINNFDYINGWPSFPDALILIVLWSVAVEEQFYLTWPILLKYIPKKVYPVIFSVIVVLTLVFRSFYTSNTDHDVAVRHFHSFAVIGDMALGGLMAYYCSYQSRFLHFITDMKRWQIWLIYAGAAACVLFRKQLFELPVMMVFERIIIAFFFGFVILEQNYAHRSFYKFSKFKTLSRLGMYTYGLYCLHFFVISIMQSSFWKLGLGINNAGTASLATLVALLVLIGLCILSFNYFEKPFLKLKERFAFITRN
jgi:peptidoglycan/LPS O-acetylase OafA/YrhL